MLQKYYIFSTFPFSFTIISYLCGSNVHIDDFLAFGNASIGILDLCRQAGATVEGMGFLIEKEFQGGRHLLQLEGIPRIESLAIIESLTDSQIKIKND